MKRTVESERRSGELRGRRELLRMAGLGAVAGAAVVVTPGAPARAAQETPKAGGYRETPHVQTYYRLARF